MVETMGDVSSAMEVEETDDCDMLKSTLFSVFGASDGGRQMNNMVFVIPDDVPPTVRSTREEGKEYCLNCALATSDLKKDECPVCYRIRSKWKIVMVFPIREGRTEYHGLIWRKNLLTGDNGKTKVSKSKPAIFDELLLRSRIHPVMITCIILRNMPDSFKKAIQTAAREEFMITQVTASNASSSAVTATAISRKESLDDSAEILTNSQAMT
ncbi:hypothetical protein T08_325 [Trichinella sp. T8]|nr:hypothetical protein T08_325 [Trichinella sp. T8]